MGWHHTYPVQREGQWHISCFQSKCQHKHTHCDIHAGELRSWLGPAVDIEVLVFQSRSEERARRLTSGLAFVEKLVERLGELKKSVTVVQAWSMKVDSLGYCPWQRRRTVQKEDTVVVEELPKVGPSDVIVEYDDTRGDDISQLLREHPVLAEVVKLSGRRSGGRRVVVSSLRAVLVAGVYHLTFVAFRCGQPPSQSPRHSQDDITPDVPDGRTSRHQPLEPTAPQLEALEPTAPEPEPLEPTSPEPEMLEPTAPEPEVWDSMESEPEMLEPSAPEEEDTAPWEAECEEDDLPPPYSECIDGSEAIRGLPPYQLYEDPPPPYQS